MAKTEFKLTKGPKLSPNQQFVVIRDEVKKRVQVAADRRASDYKAATRGWQPVHQPDFQGQVVFGRQRGPEIRIVMRNASQVFNKYGTTVKQLWDFWNKGTRPHIIQPRFASILRFVAGGVVLFSPLVRHPGTQGSGAKDRIDKRLRQAEIKAIRAGFARGFRTVERRNK